MKLRSITGSAFALKKSARTLGLAYTGVPPGCSFPSDIGEVVGLSGSRVLGAAAFLTAAGCWVADVRLACSGRHWGSFPRGQVALKRLTAGSLGLKGQVIGSLD